MRRAGIIAWKSNGSLLWTTPLALIVSLAGASLITLAVVFGLRGGHSTVVTALGVVGGTFVLVGTAGWIESVIYTRHESLPVPVAPTPQIAPRTVRQRAVVRRPNGARYYVCVGLLVLALVAVVITSLDTADYGPPAEPATLGILLTAIGILAWLILCGVSARFVVSPDELRIESTFRSVRVPRGLVGTFEPRNTDVRLNHTGLTGRTYFRVDSPIADLSQSTTLYRTNRRTQVRTIQKIIDALADVPAGAAPIGVVVKQWRLALVAVALACGTAIVTGSAIVALNWSSLPTGG